MSAISRDASSRGDVSTEMDAISRDTSSRSDVSAEMDAISRDTSSRSDVSTEMDTISRDTSCWVAERRQIPGRAAWVRHLRLPSHGNAHVEAKPV